MLIELAFDEGFSLAGICDAVSPPNLIHYENWLSREFHGEMQYLVSHLVQKRNPANLLPGAKSVLAVGLNYYQNPPLDPDGPKIARYALGRDYHKVLRSKLRRILAKLQISYPELRARICVDSAPILERDYAQLAGLGWYGKNTMLINSKQGSWFVIGLMILDRRFEPNQPAKGGCGSCRLCIEACPTGAIVPVNGGWQVDARSCVSYRTIELSGDFDGLPENPVSDWVFGCDICQEVCPFNQPRESQPARAQETREADFAPTRESLSLLEIAAMGWDQWDRWTRGSAIRRAGHEGLRRNAMAALQCLRSRGE